MMQTAVTGTYALFALVLFAFGVLAYAYLVSDFSLLNAYQNSHSLMPAIYRFSAVWGNHEGSMMLWLLILTLFSALVALFGTNLPDRLKANVLGVQAWISTAFILFILITSNPFIRLNPAPAEGRISIRFCRTPASPFIRRCFISAMSVFPSVFPLPSPP